MSMKWSNCKFLITLEYIQFQAILMQLNFYSNQVVWFKYKHEVKQLYLNFYKNSQYYYKLILKQSSVINKLIIAETDQKEFIIFYDLF